MIKIKRLKGYGRRWPGAVVALGVFDGLHRGHRAILDRLKILAKKSGHHSVLVTFAPPPQAVLAPGRKFFFLTSLEEKQRLLAEEGLDALAVIRFDRRVAKLSPQEFVQRVLVQQLRASQVVCGRDCGFGHNRSGDLPLLRRLGRRYGFRVTPVPPLKFRGVKISSTAIRQALLSGRPEWAARLLGRPYALGGTAVRGQGLGRRLGYPTLNLRPNCRRQLVPCDGVYIGRARWGRRLLPGVIFVGRRLTTGGGRTIEFHSIGHKPEGGIRKIELFFLKYLRPGERFYSSEDLAAAIGRDVMKARRYFARRKTEDTA